MRYAVIQRSLLLTFKNLVDGGKSMTLDVTFGDTQTVIDMVDLQRINDLEGMVVIQRDVLLLW